MLLTKMRALWNPDQFQGWGKTRRYFEGWYFKIVSPDEQHALAFIPGIAMNEQGERHAFIQVMDGKACRATYHRFDAADFRPSKRHFEIELGNHFFSAHTLRLDLPNCKGELHATDKQPWPKMLGAPGIMGWYSFVPFMECNHGVVSLRHVWEGGLQMNLGEGLQNIDFSGGIGYIEKDWGRSFPRAYVWMQSNHFDTSDRVSLMASVAHIPWLGSYFIGFISGFWLEDRLFRFATYTGAKQYLRIHNNQVELVFKNPGTELRITAQQAPGAALWSPLSGEMKGKIQESLLATLHVELFENKQRIFEGAGRNAGLEVAGELELLGGRV
ncbi:MAG: tocopherol cyclase family protein [Saprospiraceae bacterium]|nr:tocopherol cyclase family protein [Saprospiraceae bacterium]